MQHDAQKDFAERVRANQHRLAYEIRTEFDYIVCGAGTSGAVVAARLAANPSVRVLLLEAGGSDETDAITDPNRWPMTLGTELDWCFIAESNPRLNGRAIPYSMGKVLGGCSSINVSTWSRGHQADWDFYAAESGEASWGYQAVLGRYRRRIEAWAGGADPEYRGLDGTVHVQPAVEPHAFSFALLDGAESMGLQRFPNANGRMMGGGGRVRVRRRDRSRGKKAVDLPLLSVPPHGRAEHHGLDGGAGGANSVPSPPRDGSPVPSPGKMLSRRSRP